MTNQADPQIPSRGPLSSVDARSSFTGEIQALYYGGTRHLRQAFRIPIDLLHFNIENGRYQTKFSLLKAANPGVNINPREPHWRDQILRLLNGTWESPSTGVNTRAERAPFDTLTRDIAARGQERPGIVLEDGGVMSGNRRLAALITLSRERPDADQFRYFVGCIIPAEGGMTPADRWRLEMSAQSGQTRLLREYDPIERLLKMKEGVGLLLQMPDMTEQRAVASVANDFGTEVDTIKKDLASLRHIDQYLTAIGHSGDYWLANNLTEIFTEFEPLEQALETNGTQPRDKAKLRRSLFFIVRNEQADYRLLRDIRTAVGPRQRRRSPQGVPQALGTLLDNTLSDENLRQSPTPSSKEEAEDLVERFNSEFQAGKHQEAPITKAQRAETNLRTLVDILQGDGRPAALRQADRLRESLSNTREHADRAIQLLTSQEQ
jgi:hypothetical protein